MRVAMIGAGYVGLVSGACIADFGHEVTCIDKDPEELRRLSAAKSRSSSPALPNLWRPIWRRSGFRFLPNPTVSARPTPCSSQWEHRRAAATVTPI